MTQPHPQDPQRIRLERCVALRIDIGAEVRGGEVCLSVADNGHGIPEANRRQVFDPFYTTKLGHGGSGLGLPIVRNIVSGALGGQIGFRNLDAGGVVFEVVLPLAAPTAAAAPAAGAVAGAAGDVSAPAADRSGSRAAGAADKRWRRFMQA